MEKTINTYIKTYLVGPVEKTKCNDSGRGWRNQIKKDLENFLDKNDNPIYIFDPTEEEQNKVGFEPKAFHKKLKGWIAGGNNDLVAEYTNLIWHGKSFLEKTDKPGESKLIHILGDIDYTLKSDFIICRIEEGDAPCGTFFEIGMCLEHEIPVYVIQTMPRENYPVSFTGAVFATGGRFFENPTQLIEFLQTTYKLKVKK